MWYAEAKAKIDIPLMDSYVDFNEWSNSQLVKFITQHSASGKCVEFYNALKWLQGRNYKEAIRDCTNKVWLRWLSDNLPVEPKIYKTIKAGETITITKGRNEKYALWAQSIFDLPEEYVGEIIYESAQL